MSKDSYSAAGIFPIKLLLHPELISNVIENKKIYPIHAQFLPTNKCNLKCSFCSCADVDKQQELTLSQCHRIIRDLAELNCKSVTITGGGEPLIHKEINEIIELFYLNDISIGMATNGLLLDRLDAKSAKRIKWIRVSLTDERPVDAVLEKIKQVPENTIDWAFSYVVTGKPDMDNAERAVKFANENEFTHIRFVADILNPADCDLSVLEGLSDYYPNLDIIIQGRNEFTRGSACFIGFLKPLIAADGLVYPCCGTQYAKSDMLRYLPENMALGSAYELRDIYNRSGTPFAGWGCDKCYYKNYNDALGSLLNGIKHEDFI